MGTHSSKVQGKWEHKYTQLEEQKKSKQSTKIISTPYAKRIHDQQINDDKEDHKSNGDGGALVMMCGKNEDPYLIE